MAVIVEKHIGKPVSVPNQLRHSGVVAIWHPAGVIAEKQAHQHPPQHAAMGKNGHRASWKGPGSRFHPGNKPVGIGGKVLRPVYMPRHWITVEAKHILRLKPFQVAKGQILPPAQADFPKRRIPAEGQPFCLVNGAGG